MINKKYSHSDYVDCLRLYREDIDEAHMVVVSIGKITLNKKETLYVWKEDIMDYGGSVKIVLKPLSKERYDMICRKKDAPSSELWCFVKDSPVILDIYPEFGGAEKTFFTYKEVKSYADKNE